MTSPRVSVVVLFHDEVEFLEEAVGSIADQRFASYEILLVDGGATAACRALAEQLCAADPERRLLLTLAGPRPEGISAYRALGFTAARGEYLASLDADDVWLPGKMAAQVALLDAYPLAGMVYGRTEIWWSWSRVPGGVDFFHDLGVTPDRLVESWEILRLLIRNEAQTPTTCNAMMRRSAYLAAGGVEHEFPGMFEDQALYAKVAAIAPVYVSSEVWARYRQRRASMAHTSADLAVARLRRRFIAWLGGALKARGEVDPRVTVALRQQRCKTAFDVLRLALKRLLGR